jgi:hypothetical protein
MPPSNDESNDEGKAPVTLGALLGWMRYPARNGIILRLQVSRSLDLARSGRYEQYDVSLGSLQMRTLGEFLIHSADEREGRVTPARRKGWWPW